MKLAMTLMVRDEADIIAATLEHHRRQGVDIFIITDNGSIDGTREIIEEFATRANVDLRDDPEHRKQQWRTVTQMARDAATVHRATWVINADADEFWFPVEPGVTLHDVFSKLPTTLGAFTVPVHDMTGVPALSGSGLERLIYRDNRSVEQIATVGLHAHATPDAVHVASPDVEVAQGNHFVNIESMGEPTPELRLEVLHLPWRSWRQYRGKVENAGRAYENNSGLSPSPNHHGMRDYRRLQDGNLLATYVIRHPTADELAAGVTDGTFVPDERIALEALPQEPDVLMGRETIVSQRTIAIATWPLEKRLVASEVQRVELANEVARQRGEIDSLRGVAERAQALLEAQERRKVVRLADAVARVVHLPKGD
jgi:hypothetical protein